jgi:hypothetical protein
VVLSHFHELALHVGEARGNNEDARRITDVAEAAPDTEADMMTQVLVVLTAVLFWLSPLLLVGGLLALAGWRDRRALAATAHQTRLTDALADEIGVIVAPVVERRRGTWRVTVAVPLERPLVVARILWVLHRALGRLGCERYEIVLSPQEPAPPAPVHRPRTERRARAA